MMPKNDLWKLPPELREQVYLHAFAVRQNEQKGDYVNNRLDLRLIGDRIFLTPSKSRKYRNRGHHALPLLRTCKAICSEASPALYSSLEFKLILGSSPSRSFWHDELIDIDLGFVEQCAFLRHVRLLNVSMELKSKFDADALVDEQCQALWRALPRLRRLVISHIYVALFPDVPPTYDATILQSFEPLLGEDVRMMPTIRNDRATRRFSNSIGVTPGQAQGLTPFAAAQIAGSEKCCF